MDLASLLIYVSLGKDKCVNGAKINFALKLLYSFFKVPSRNALFKILNFVDTFSF